MVIADSAPLVRPSIAISRVVPSRSACLAQPRRSGPVPPVDLPDEYLSPLWYRDTLAFFSDLLHRDNLVRERE